MRCLGLGFLGISLGGCIKRKDLFFFNFLQSGDEIGLVLGRLNGVGFSTVAEAGVCLAFPSVLRCLFVKLRSLVQRMLLKRMWSLGTPLVGRLGCFTIWGLRVRRCGS